MQITTTEFVKRKAYLQLMKIDVYIDNIYIIVSNMPEDKKALIKECFTFKDASKAFNVSGEFDRRRIKLVRLYSERKNSIILYSGFLKDFLILCKKEKISINVTDKRKKIKNVPSNLRSFFPEEFEHTEHQESALEAMLKTHCGIIKAPTSSGKSSIIIAYLKVTKQPSLILVNKIDLANQLYNNIKDAGLDVGICTGKKFIEEDIMVSTIFSIKKIKNIEDFKIVIVDETHHSCSNVYQEFFKKNNVPFRFGFSATPENSDPFKWGLTKQHVGSIIYEVNAHELMDKKVLAKPTIKFLNHNCKRTLDWESGYRINIIGNESRNNKIKEVVEDYDVPTLIIVRYIDHGNILEKLLENSVFLNGDVSSDDRQEAVKDFENGKIKTIIATAIFNEGISINAIRLLVIASAGKSKIEVLQRLGRSLRIDKKTNKYTVDVYDFFDKGNRFTEKHSKERIRIYKKEGFDVLLP